MEFLSINLLLLIFSIFVCLYFFFIHPKSRKTKENGFRIYPLVGYLPGFLWNRHRYLDWTTRVLASTESNTATFHRPGKVHGVLTANPQIIEYTMKTNFENYPKGLRFRTIQEDFLGKGIFNTDDELWKIQRKTASYEFSTKSLRNFALENVTMELQTRLVPLLAKAAKTDRILDVQDILERFAFDNICKVAFDVDPGCLDGDATSGGEFMQAFEDAATVGQARFMYIFPAVYKIKRFLNLGSEKRLRKSIAIVHDFADKIIRSRMEEKFQKKDEDLLSRFMGNSENSVEFLRDIIISFILAGRDTTSSALSWFFWQLSSRPDVEDQILEELKNIRRRNRKVIGEAYSFEELREMNYLQAAISEAMRFYPPVPVHTRACKEDDVLPGGTFIGKDWLMTYHTYAMGRMESIWGQDCCEYKPERWLENGICKQENPFKFPVFHAGPRQCLGKDMAYIQMKSIAAAVLERFGMDVLLEKGKRPEHVLSLTLRMKGGLPVKVKERTV